MLNAFFRPVTRSVASLRPSSDLPDKERRRRRGGGNESDREGAWLKGGGYRGRSRRWTFARRRVSVVSSPGLREPDNKIQLL